jgi:cellulose biosynthesis protein BcsQ
MAAVQQYVGARIQMPTVLAVANQKGGCGKTTLSMNIAGALAREGNYRVLLIDSDPQASAMQWRKNTEESGFPSIFSPFPTLYSTKKSQSLLRNMISCLSIARLVAAGVKAPIPT